MRLILVRHGETAWNAERRYQGYNSIPLNERGRWQAIQAGKRLASMPVVALYASDVTRAWETAQLVSDQIGLQAMPLLALREINDGDWAGFTPEELLIKYPEHMAVMRQFPATTRRLNGESYAELQTRVIALFHDLAHKHEHQLVVAVSHGGAIRALVCGLLDMPLEHFGRLWVDNGGFVEIVPHADAWRVHKINDTAHLDTAFATGE